MAQAVATYGKDIVLILTPSEAKGLLTLAIEGERTAKSDPAWARAELGNPRAVDCAYEAVSALAGAAAAGSKSQRWNGIVREREAK